MKDFTAPELRVLLEALNGLMGPWRGGHTAGDENRTDARIGNDLAQAVCDELESRGVRP